MTNPQGAPIWYELATTDADDAKAFYADVVGWTVAPMPTADGSMQGYQILTAPGGLVAGGLTALPDGAAMAPGWYCYLSVEDVDGMAEQIKQRGGGVHMGPMDIPNVGRFAFCSDPQGLNFYIMRGDSPEGSQAFQMNSPGHAAWNELVSSDHKAAIDFYGPLFGWEVNETMPMGDMGDYAFIDHAGVRIGAMMTAGAGWPMRWSCYFNVPSIDAAKARVEQGGGAITHGPQEVPGGMFIIQGTDPQGVAFALVGGK